MSFADVKLAYAFSCVVLSLIILSPTLAHFVSFPEGEKFSELWILGPSHMTEGYPLNVSAGESYKVYLGVGNHMGSFEHYKIYVKLGNRSEPLPNISTGLASALEPVYEYHVFLRNNEIWEREFSFSFDVSFNENNSNISKLVINGYAIPIIKTAAWDTEKQGYFYHMFFELWIYNATLSEFQFHNRYVGLQLNITEKL